MSRYARKVDSNHGIVVDALERAGASVLSLASLGNGAPDVCFGIHGRTHLAEIKPDTKLKAHALRDNQALWAAKWRGSPVHVLRNPFEAFELVNLIRMAAQGRATNP